MTDYVAGFMFSEDKECVALIRKNRPEWQKGMYNGIGGHVDPGEYPIEAMIREFEEEAGVVHEDWQHFCTLNGQFGTVYFYKTTGDLGELRQMTDEMINKWPVELPSSLVKVIPNLKWLIPLALSEYNESSVVTHNGCEPDGGW